jgi:hypothetical protein
LTVAGAAFIHPDLAVTLKHQRIHRFQAKGADTGGVFDFPATAIRFVRM